MYDGSSAPGQMASHFATTSECAACHNTMSWLPVTDVDHDQVLGAYASCHSLPGEHINSCNACIACHRTDRWTPTFTADHNEVNGLCSLCHQLPVGHCSASDECSVCHDTNTWLVPTGTLPGGSGSPAC